MVPVADMVLALMSPIKWSKKLLNLINLARRSRDIGPLGKRGRVGGVSCDAHAIGIQQMNNEWWVFHIKQLVLPKFGIKRKFAPCWRTYHAAVIGQMWPEIDVPHRRKLVMQRTLAKCGKIMMLLIGGLCLTADFDQMWSKICPSLEDFVSLKTLTKCGPKCAPLWRTCLTADFDQMWSEMWPLLEDFVWLRTSTRCGPNMCPSSEDFVTLWTSTKCCPNMCPLMEDFVLLRSSTTYGSTTYSSSNKAGSKQTVSKHQLMWNWNRCLWLRCHMINTLEGICTNKTWQKNDASHIHHTTNDKWRRSHTTITNTALYSMREESFLIGFTWTSWRVDATMMALFACRRLEQNSNEGATPTTTNHGQKAWLSLTTVGSSTTHEILLKLGALQSLAWLVTTVVP